MFDYIFAAFNLSFQQTTQKENDRSLKSFLLACDKTAQAVLAQDVVSYIW